MLAETHLKTIGSEVEISNKTTCLPGSKPKGKDQQGDGNHADMKLPG